MCVNNISFMVSLGQGIKFTTIEHMKDWRARTLIKGIDTITSVSNNHSMIIDNTFIDNEFEVLQSDIQDMQITLNIAATSTR